MDMKFAFLAAFAVCGAMATACTVTTTTGGGGSGGGATVTTGSGTVTSTHATVTSTTGTVNPTTTTGGDACANPTSAADCSGSCTTQASCEDTTGTATECCEKVVPGGEDAFNTVFINDCACAAAADCKTQCGGATDICAVPTATPSAACNTCLQAITSTSACVQTVKTDCAADPTKCEAYITCVSGCPAA
jgi:hypothetical protein